MKILNERYLSRRSRNPSVMISFQFAGSCQSSSVGDQFRGLGKFRYLRMSGFAG